MLAVMSEGFRTFDHTGDLGLEVWAESPARLYARAAEAVMAQLAEVGGAAAEVERTLRLSGDDPADLLIHWLNSALLEAELAGAVWNAAEVRRLTATSLEAVLRGPRLGPGGPVRLREVKAVSHHGLVLELAGPVCRCRLVLDL